MEKYIQILIGIFIAAVVINSVISFLDLRIKSYLAYFIETIEAEKNTIILNDEQMRKIGEFAAKCMEKDDSK